jgi:hypothetical protein
MEDAKAKLDKLKGEDVTPEVAEQIKQWDLALEQLNELEELQNIPIVKAIANELRNQITAINIILIEGEVPQDREGKVMARIGEFDRAIFGNRKQLHHRMIKLLVGAEQAKEALAKSIDEAIEREEQINK